MWHSPGVNELLQVMINQLAYSRASALALLASRMKCVNWSQVLQSVEVRSCSSASHPAAALSTRLQTPGLFFSLHIRVHACFCVFGTRSNTSVSQHPVHHATSGPRSQTPLM